jgi:predicted house-cleaning noncanonical NTP pyrophosphatase (MazG superfamily)
MVKKIYYNKLIRDKIPERIIECGGDYKVRKLKGKEFVIELLKKAGEEASGLLAAKTKKDIIKELADVVDVTEEIMKVKGISRQEIKKQQQENKKLKGGFNERLFLYWSSDTGYKTNEIKYGKN